MVLNSPLQVVGVDENFHQFTPQFGLGIVSVDAAHADPAVAIDEAERLALQTDLAPEAQDPDAETTPASLLPMRDSAR
jgi:hypothetical protein